MPLDRLQNLVGVPEATLRSKSPREVGLWGKLAYRGNRAPKSLVATRQTPEGQKSVLRELHLIGLVDGFAPPNAKEDLVGKVLLLLKALLVGVVKPAGPVTSEVAIMAQRYLT